MRLVFAVIMVSALLGFLQALTVKSEALYKESGKHPWDAAIGNSWQTLQKEGSRLLACFKPCVAMGPAQDLKECVQSNLLFCGERGLHLKQGLVRAGNLESTHPLNIGFGSPSTTGCLNVRDAIQWDVLVNAETSIQSAFDNLSLHAVSLPGARLSASFQAPKSCCFDCLLYTSPSPRDS